MLSTDSSPAASSAYVHLPFCKRRCYYCDFPVSVVGANHSGQVVQDGMQAYVDLLCHEIKATHEMHTQPLQTIFFGGGTPSLIPPHMLQQILATLAQCFGIALNAEISMEADPGTFDAARLRDYMALGVKRFSVGVQAFQEDLLKACGRSHTLADVHEAIAAVHEAGVPAWSLDLMSGLPFLTPELWQQSLKEAIAAEPSHISVYDLQVEDKTPFGRWYKPGASPLPSDSTAANMYQAASQTLRHAGFEHYEVSNYAKPGFRCQHNLVYWHGAPFLAFGLGAASYLRSRRFSRPRKMAAYTAWVDGFCAAGGGVPGLELPAESAEDRLLDMVMLRLRLADGLDLRQVEDTFGRATAADVRRVLQRHVSTGLVTHNDTNVMRLSDPAGFLVSNDIISDVFAAVMPDE
ncbi:hypothetical protein WJX72_007398 [[Myrmecia] bisecta]|uniref:Radical S-adenosyl methionine domain-containing protein 1, mitochondrial n=1 Tax=[Myrmecia] bisecta TaxID=41462 RepID=A0AAW1PLS9_9CHLO